MSGETVGQIVKRLRKAAGMSQAQLAKRARMGQPTVSDIEGDKRVQPASLFKLAEALGVPAELLLKGQSQEAVEKPLSNRLTISYISVKGEVEAGAWRQMGYEEANEFADLAIPTDPKYPEGALFGLIVRGTSVNRFARDGDIAVCLDVWQAPRPPQHNDMVVVRRVRNSATETTIKRAKWYNGSLQLFTESDDPAFDNSKPISIESDNGTRTEVIAFVLHFVRPMTDI